MNMTFSYGFYTKIVTDWVCVAVVALSLAIFNCYVLLLLSLSIVQLRLSTSNKVYDDGNAVEQYLVYSIHDQVIGTIKRNECFTSWVRIRSPVGMPLSRDTSVMKFSCRSDQFFFQRCEQNYWKRIVTRTARTDQHANRRFRVATNTY